MDSIRLRHVPLELGAVVGPIALTLAWLLLGLLSPGYTLWGTRVAPYSPVSQPISGLGLGPTGPYMNTAFVLCGVLMIAGAWGIFRSLGGLNVGAHRSVAVLFALPGLGSVIDGLFTFQTFLLHFAGFALVLTTVVTFPLAGWFVRRTPGLRRLGNALIAAGPLTLGLTVLYFATFTPTVAGIETGIAGLTERALILEIQAWYVAMGWVAFKKGVNS
jgi:Protein of unknown function (DUF998)